MSYHSADNELLARAMGYKTGMRFGGDSPDCGFWEDWGPASKARKSDDLVLCVYTEGCWYPWNPFTDPAACLELLEWARKEELFNQVYIIGKVASWWTNSEPIDGPFIKAFPAAVVEVLRTKESK